MKFNKHLIISDLRYLIFSISTVILLFFHVPITSATEIIAKDVVRIDHDTVLLKFNDGSESIHRLSTGEKLPYRKIQKEEPDTGNSLNNLLKSFDHNPNAKEIKNASSKALFKSEKIASVSIKDSKTLNLKLYSVKDFKILKDNVIKRQENLDDIKSKSSRSTEIELLFSEHGKYLLLKVFDTLLYIFDANSLKLLHKIMEDSTGTPRFTFNDERFILRSGCACEGQDNRTLTIISVKNSPRRLDLNYANHFSNAVQDFHIENDFVWAVNEKEIITWDLKTLKLHKRFKHNSCGDLDFFREILMNDSSDGNDSIFMQDKDTGYLACARNSHLKLYKLSKGKPMIVLDKSMDSIFKAFLLPQKVVIVNQKGTFTIVPFSTK